LFLFSFLHPPPTQLLFSNDPIQQQSTTPFNHPIMSYKLITVQSHSPFHYTIITHTHTHTQNQHIIYPKLAKSAVVHDS